MIEAGANPMSGLVRQVAGKETIPLDDPSWVWLVRSGAVAVFRVCRTQDGLVGQRDYLFDVAAPEALFGSPPGEPYALVAVPLGSCELMGISAHEIEGPLTRCEPEALTLVRSWIWALSNALDASEPLTVALEVADGSRLTLPAGQAIRPDLEGPVPWLRVIEGELDWMGDAGSTISVGLSPFAGKQWAIARTPVEIEVTRARAVQDGPAIVRGVLDLTERFVRRQGLLAQTERDLAFAGFRRRQHNDRQLAQATLADLAGLLDPRSRPLPSGGNPLLAAARSVGQAMGMEIHPPASSEDPGRARDPLDPIARASRMRTRDVLLSGNWWDKEAGPLLAYRADGRAPVALLPAKRRGHPGYVLFDPDKDSRVPVDEAVARTLYPLAVMFYKPLPLSAKKAIDLLKFSAQGRIHDYVWMLVAGIVGTVLGMLTPQVTGLLIDRAIPDSNHQLLLDMGLGLVATALGSAIFQFTQNLLVLRIEGTSDASLQAAVWDRVLSLDVPFFRKYQVGDLSSRIMGISQIRSQLSGTTMRSILSGLFAVLNLGLMATYSPQLTLLTVAVAFGVILVTSLHGYLKIRVVRDAQRLTGALAGLVTQLIGGVAKLRVTGSEARAFHQWAEQYGQLRKLMTRSKAIDNSLSVINSAVPILANLLIYYFAMSSKMMQAQGGGALTTGIFLAFMSAYGTFMSGATSLSGSAISIMAIAPIWERSKAILEADVETDEAALDPGRLSGDIEVANVSFRYTPDGPLILDDVSLRIKPGEVVALVGGSGCGKSTLFRLLLGFEKPEAGSLYYDGKDLSRLDLRAVRRQLGTVLQNGKLMSAPMFENIACGARISHEDAWEAARCAGLDADIEQMPMGMHTVVSEGGSNLSGGQRQRLLIARAFALKPRIMLFDEATSALDNKTQAIVTESLTRLNVSRVVIAHRLSTIRDADRIYVLDKGHVVQAGTFNELLNQEGLFARLAARQMA